MQDHPSRPDPLTLDPYDPRGPSLTWVHDQLDMVERQRAADRDIDADPAVRNARAQGYLDRKALADQLEDIDAGAREARLIELVFVAALLGMGVWAAALSRVLF